MTTPSPIKTQAHHGRPPLELFFECWAGLAVVERVTVVVDGDCVWVAVEVAVEVDVVVEVCVWVVVVVVVDCVWVEVAVAAIATPEIVSASEAVTTARSAGRFIGGPLGLGA